MDNTQAKISALRTVIEDHGLDGYIVPKADEFQGEFVAPYAERLKWLTDFTGSAGIAVVLKDKACVLSDGRYTLQLDAQVDRAVFDTADSVKTGAHGWLEDNADEGYVIGFDPMLFTVDQIESIEEKSPKVVLKPVEGNLIDKVWFDQPEKPMGQVVLFNEQIAGKAVREKKAEIAGIVRQHEAQACILTMPDSISWLLNVRGSDIDFIPSVLSYAIVYADEAKPVSWIIDQEKLEQDVLNALDVIVEVKGFDCLDELQSGTVLLDPSSAPLWFKRDLERRQVEVKNIKDPCVKPKAAKTVSEYDAIKKAHIADGIALVKFLRWLDLNTPAEDVTELDAEAKLYEFRKEHDAFKGASFPTIAGYGPNGAIVHYRSSEKTNIPLNGGSLFLVDSGGQYYDGTDIAGTTDITRTIAIGEPSSEMVERNTLVLQGHIAVAQARFPQGTTGAQVDTLARQPLWSEHLDFAHGTGHGVGCYLAVHEEAANISPRGKTAFEAGMLISNEPGYYKSNEYGIRIENLIYVRETGQTNSNGTAMLDFETVSYAPIDVRLIDVSLLSKQEKGWLNRYHALVFETLSLHLGADEKDWLEQKTKAL